MVMLRGKARAKTMKQNNESTNDDLFEFASRMWSKLLMEADDDS